MRTVCIQESFEHIQYESVSSVSAFVAATADVKCIFVSSFQELDLLVEEESLRQRCVEMLEKCFEHLLYCSVSFFFFLVEIGLEICAL